MHIALFYHSLRSDWNHGNAHFLRGIASELHARGHTVRIFEPEAAWSLVHLVAEHGEAPLHAFQQMYPHLSSTPYVLEQLDLQRALDGIDLVLVHEWNEPALVQRLGLHHRRNPGYVLLFHDTHHRAVTHPESLAAYDLSQYDGVLAYGSALRDLYLLRSWAARAWVWHEAADTQVFYPRQPAEHQGDLVWIGNWGDDERTAELHEFLIQPVVSLRLQARLHGVRYPKEACEMLERAGLTYAGWLPNYQVPEIFAQFRLTLHIPRRPYVQALPGIPTIRPFEALACGIPLLCSPWQDVEGLFTPGKDFVVARDGRQMQRAIRALLHEPAMAREIAAHGRQTVLQRHTCAHRVDELLRIWQELKGSAAPVA
ncbi:MAG: glycosyltransferase [Candidatus Tectimicrobiota bacterium]